MLRITGGEYKGRRLKAPAGQDTRPTADKVKEALFAILGAAVRGARAADFFAGSGALGLECLSRGALSCLFVEKRRQALSIIKENLAALNLQDRSVVLTADAARPSRRLLAAGPWELVLADPPYEKGLVQKVVGLAAEHGFLAPGGLMVIEHSPRERPRAQGGLKLADHRVYGQTELTFFAG
jgi:16S rRNA (guanine966-N2)-methyltransferase